MKLISTSRKLIAFSVLLSVISLILVSCGLSSDEQAAAAIYATQYAKDPVNNIPPAHYQTLAAQYGYVIPIATATPTPNQNWTPTMSFYDFSGTQVAQQQNISMTNQANQMEMERERMAAEAKAAQQATAAYYAQETAEAFRIESTAQEQERRMIATANAQGTAMMWTAQAQATSTAYQSLWEDRVTGTAAAQTAIVAPTVQAWTQTAESINVRIANGEARKVELAVRRQELKNVFDAFLPWTISVGGIVVLALGFMQFVKTRVHQRDEHGAVPLLQMRADNGDTILVKAENMETGVMKIQKDGSVVRYAPMDTQEQSDITRRNQAVEAIRALPTPYAQTGGKIITSEFSTTHARVTVGNPSAIRPALDEADQGLMEEIKND